MGSASRLLTVELLEELKARWRAQHAPLVQFLRPGLADEELDAITASLGLRVPAEARVWWRWHDGVEPERRPFERQMAGTGWKFFSLHTAVAQAVEQRDRATEIADATGVEADPVLWRWAWLPLADDYHGGVIAVDGTAPADQTPTPIYYSEPEMGAKDAQPGSQTFGEMVQWWIDAFDDGVFGYDAQRGRWIYHHELLDRARELTGLV